MKRAYSDSTDSENSSVSDTEGDIFDDDDIEEVLQNLSQSIPKEKALAFLHTLGVSKSILYWNSHGEMMYHQRRIPVTNIAELIEYAMLPYNLDVRAPRGFKTFTEGLAEVGIDKKLIRNKRLLADLVARQPEEEEDSNLSESQSSDEDDEDGDEQETDQPSESSESAESSGSDDEPRECHVCRDFVKFYSIPVVECPRCLWREGYYYRGHQRVECDNCSCVIPVDANTMKAKFYRCRDCDAVHQLSLKFKKLKLMDDRDDQEELT